MTDMVNKKDEAGVSSRPIIISLRPRTAAAATALTFAFVCAHSLISRTVNSMKYDG